MTDTGLPRDDTGFPVRADRPVGRVVSLVPSLTESVAVTRPEALAGATDWCTHPADLDVPRVRGTKNPDLAAIAAPGARPRACQQGGEPAGRRRAPARGRDTRLGDGDQDAGRGARLTAPDVQRGAGLAGAGLAGSGGTGVGEPPPGRPVRAAIPVWRDPWMVVGSGTFTGDIAARLGLGNVYGDHPSRYPHVSLEDLCAREPGGDHPAGRAVSVHCR